MVDFTEAYKTAKGKERREESANCPILKTIAPFMRVMVARVSCCFRLRRKFVAGLLGTACC